MKSWRSIPARLLAGTLALGCTTLGAATTDLAEVQARLAAGDDPQALAAELTPAARQDLQALNALRLGLKAASQEAQAQALLSALAEQEATEAVLLNLSLAYVDQMAGKNLLRQGNLSSRSQDQAQRLTDQDPGHWAAWYIRGLNNLYWPDWFGKAAPARDYLTEAVTLSRRRAEAGDPADRYALGYLALGDAYALLDQPAQARAIWTEGAGHYPYVTALGQRLALGDAQLHAAVRALRDADKPINTNLSFLWAPLSGPYRLTLVAGTLFGPGPLPDQPLNPGSLKDLQLGPSLTGTIPANNNGAAEPNLPGEILQGKTLDGLLSDGAPANESVDVGFVSLMNGRFNLFLAAIQDGPNQGEVHFFLDRGWSWTIRDDIGIDPGFPVGVVKFHQFVFSTSPRVIPFSRQTEGGAPAGVDRAGGIPSGEVVPGALGDADFDGRLDGVFNALGRFPFDSVMLPGAPFAQTRVFQTDIPVSADQAALLTLANGLSYLSLAVELQASKPELAADLRATWAERLDLARRHGERSHLAPEARATLDRLAASGAATDQAGLCDGYRLVETAAPAAGLQRQPFDGSGIKTVCMP